MALKQTLAAICGAMVFIPSSFAGDSRINPRITYSASCTPYRAQLESKVLAAITRFQDCVNNAFVKEDIARRMIRALEDRPSLLVHCEEPPRSIWCAAGGFGEVWLSPSRMLRPGSICHEDIGAYFIHEVGHLANLDTAPAHNDMGETYDRDEIYSLQNYCMRPARMWVQRNARTGDVVEPSKLACMRYYQELTPTTLQDPFWEGYSRSTLEGRDACSSSEMDRNSQPIAPPCAKCGRKGS